MYVKTLLLASLFLMSLASCSVQKSNTYIDELSNKEAILSANNRLEQIANLWTGHFSNKQAIKDGATTTDLEQEIIGRRIWKKNRPGEYWLYTGWFQSGSYEKAIAASIAQITRISPDTAFIAFYNFAAPETVPAFEWTQDQPFKNLSKDDLLPREEGCGSFIIRVGEGKYKMVANEACFGPMSDLVKYYKINGVLSPEHILFNTLFLNGEKEFVFSHKDNRFDRFNKKELEQKYEQTVLTSGS